MNATISTTAFDGFRWTVVSGPRADAFGALGHDAAADIRQVLGEIPDLAALRARCAADPAFSRHVEAIGAASKRAFPQVWTELQAMAEGAGVDPGDLLLLNLRGDVGPTGPLEGCTSVAWGDHGAALLGHNEDGAAILLGRCRLLTMAIEGEIPVTAWWYPGFLPSNTFFLNADGLVCAIDNVNIVRPATAPGRHFVSRALQACTTLGEAEQFLRAHPSAGGFAYTLGDLSDAGLGVVETAAGATNVEPYPYGGGFRPHANHLRLFPAGLDAPDSESLGRGEIFAATAAPSTPEPEWLLTWLGSDKPLGVRRHAAGPDPLMTLATFVVELVARQITVTARGAGPLRLTAEAFATGQPALHHPPSV